MERGSARFRRVDAPMGAGQPSGASRVPGLAVAPLWAAPYQGRRYVVKKRFYFLRFVAVLLRIMAALLLIAGIVGIILAFRIGGAGEGALANLLRWVSRAGGILALISGLFYFIAFWGLAELIWAHLVIEESTRGVASRLAELESRLSAAEIGAAAAKEVTKALEAREMKPELKAVAEAPPVTAAAEREVAEAEEARLRAKETLDRTLKEAARQMAQLEGAPPESAPGAEDDLSQITGIGPVFRVRLRQAGITTFAQVAAATPEQLAAITEQSVDRVIRDDWIGQAKKLAGG